MGRFDSCLQSCSPFRVERQFRQCISSGLVVVYTDKVGCPRVVGILSGLSSLFFYILFNFSLAFCNESINEAILES